MDVSNPQDIERIVRAVLQSMNKHPVSPTAGNSPAMSPATWRWIWPSNT